MLAVALQAERRAYLERYTDEADAAGRRLVVGNGARAREITTAAGRVEVQAPRVHDRRPGERFTSSLLPPYMRRSPKVTEVLPGDGPGVWGMNIKSCAICHAFSEYDAMDLVPYMCATDDVISDRFNQGLRRTGTIALGAHQCDFSYMRGGEPLRLVEQYPQRIRVDQGQRIAGMRTS